MLALRKLQPGSPLLALEDIPPPQAGPAEVLIEVAYAGICGTDLHIQLDEFPSEPPVTLGHEIAGRIAALGEGVEGWQIGEPVTTETYFHTCQRCVYCRSGAPNLCAERRSIGSRENGGFARYLRIPARNLHRLPAQLSLQAATFTEPLACVVHALLEQTSLTLGERCIVSGPGPIGLLCAQVARASGCSVVVLGTDVDVRRLAVARSLGFTTHAVNEPNLKETLWQQTDGRGVDVVIECAGAEASAALALELVRPRGKYIQVGLFGRSIAWNADLACLKELRITGSNATVPSAWPKAIALLASGVVQTEPLVSEVVPLSGWERAFAQLRQKDALKILLRPEQEGV